MVSQDDAHEKDLWKSYKKTHSKQSKDALILYYLWYVKYICGRIAVELPSHIKSEDLVSSGVLGLIDAIEKFDDKRDSLFKTYAFTRIRGSVIDELRKLDWAPRALRRKAREIKHAVSALEQKFNRHPTVEEIASELRVSADEVSRVERDIANVPLLSLEEVLRDFDEQKGLSRLDTIEDRNAINAKEVSEGNEKAKLIAKQLESLPEKERLVITLYYFEELTLKDIGRAIGVSESRVSQLHSQAMINIRKGIKRMMRFSPESANLLQT